MTKKEFIDKWQDHLELHQRVYSDVLMYTIEDRQKSAHFAGAIAAMLADAKMIEDPVTHITPIHE